jgi:hypothetical protein
MRRGFVLGAIGLAFLANCTPRQALPTIAAEATGIPQIVATPSEVLAGPTDTVVAPRLTPTVGLPIAETGAAPDPTVSQVMVLQRQCDLDEPIQQDVLASASGLVVSTLDGQQAGISIVGADGFGQLQQLTTWEPGHLPLPIVSSTTDRIASQEFQPSGQSGTIELGVLYPPAMSHLAVSVENTTPAKFDRTEWLSEDEVLVPLPNDGDQARWLKWTVATSTQVIEEVTLPGLGQEMSKYSIPPVVDPTFQLVIYGCTTCGVAEYVTRSTSNGQVIWSFDSGQDWTYRTLPVWSPDGNLVALTGAKHAQSNWIWIISRTGEIVQEIELPEANQFLSAIEMQWSPDSKSLGFLLATPLAPPSVRLTLSVISLESKQAQDLCIEANPFYWAPDSSRIAFSSQLKPEDRSRIITIVNLVTREVTEIHDELGHRLWGWINLDGR